MLGPGSVEGQYEVEVTYAGKAILLRADTRVTATYLISGRDDDDNPRCEGHAVASPPEGPGVRWSFKAVGENTGGGATTWRGSLAVETMNPDFATLDGQTISFEAHADERGTTKGWLAES